MNLKPGRYLCRVVAPSNGWFGEAGEKQTPFIRIPLVIAEGEEEGYKLTYQAWVSDSAAKRTIDNLKEVFEWNGDVVSLAKQIDNGPFVGRECSIVIEEEQYKGKTRVVVKWLNSPSAADKTVDANRALQLAQHLAAQMGGEPTPEDQKKAAPRAGYGQARNTAVEDPNWDNLGTEP